MKAVAAQEQACSCMWELPRKDIWRCERCHVYRKGKQEFVSVTRVSKALLPTDYAAIDPITLKIAMVRGILVDQYFTEWLVQGDDNMIPLADVPEMIAPQFPPERTDGTPVDRMRFAIDTAERTMLLIAWWKAQGWTATAIHRIVYDERAGVAGETDVETEGRILDLKVVSAIQPNYELQLGGYLELDGGEKQGAVIHVTKEFVRLVPYNAQRARMRWRSGLDWYWTKEGMLT